MENRKILFYGSRIIVTVIVFIFIAWMITPATITAEPVEETIPATSEVYIPSEPEEKEIKLEPFNFPLERTADKEKLLILMEKCETRIEEAEKMRESALALGYDNTHPVITLANQEYENAEYNLECYREQMKQIEIAEEKARWEKKEKEYPEATKIWLYLKDYGYNDYVCAGILGNIMAEVGGQTLNIRPNLYDDSGYYYGICQWNFGNYGEIHGASLGEQLQFLVETVPFELNSSGFAYQSGFDVEDFLNLNNEQDAAIAFAKAYERCGSNTYSIRAYNATTAYNYFVNN